MYLARTLDRLGLVAFIVTFTMGSFIAFDGMISDDCTSIMLHHLEEFLLVFYLHPKAYRLSISIFIIILSLLALAAIRQLITLCEVNSRKCGYETCDSWWPDIDFFGQYNLWWSHYWSSNRYDLAIYWSLSSLEFK
jgi:hypothetical protein